MSDATQFEGDVEIIASTEPSIHGEGSLEIAKNFTINDGYAEFNDITAPAHAGAAKGRLYKKTGDDGFFWKPDAAGTELDLTRITILTNDGAGGVSVIKSQTETDARLKSINAGSNKVTVTDDVANDEIDIDVNRDNVLGCDTKGDIIVHDGATHQCLPVGTTGQVLTVNPGTGTGVKWEDIGNVSAGDKCFKKVTYYDYDGVTNPGGDLYAKSVLGGNSPNTVPDPTGDQTVYGWDELPDGLTAGVYSDIHANDGSFTTQTTTAGGQYAQYLFRFKIQDNKCGISQIVAEADARLTDASGQATKIQLWIWNHGNTAWEMLDEAAKGAFEDLSGSLITNTEDYFDEARNLYLMVSGDLSHGTGAYTVNVDYVRLCVTENFDANYMCIVRKCIDFEEFSAGTKGDDIMIPLVTLSTNDPNNHDLMIFDSASPTGGDVDLGTPHTDFGGPGMGIGGAEGKVGENRKALGKILIISEDNNSGDPNDYAGGGNFNFVWDCPVIVDSIEFIDNEEMDATVMLYNEDDDLINTTNVPDYGDNSYICQVLDTYLVKKMVVTFVGSGGIGSVCYRICKPANRFQYEINPTKITASSSSYQNPGRYFVWKHSEYVEYSTGKAIYEADIAGTRTLDLQIYDFTNNVPLATESAIATSGFRELSFTLPTGNARIGLRLRRSLAGDVPNPVIYGTQLEFTG